MPSGALPPAMERILEAARWAPSGDNAQAWNFNVTSDSDLTIAFNRETGNVYQYRGGEPNLLAAGALLENIAIAAPSVGKRSSWRYQGFEDGVYRVAVHLEDAPTQPADALLETVPRRSVDRRPYHFRPLPPDTKALLTETAGPEVKVEWFESLAERRKIAALAKLGTDIRLRIPETHGIHRRIVDWDRALSPDGIPSRSLGLDAMTLKLMRWFLADWKRTQFGNRMGSPLWASLQMDLLPGFFSAAYFAFRLAPGTGDEHVVRVMRAGQAMQRFWLTATSLGLALQPCLAVLAFSHYGATYRATGEAFTASERERRSAVRLADEASKFFSHTDELVFLARIGFPRSRPESRSVRKPLAGQIRDCRPEA